MQYVLRMKAIRWVYCLKVKVLELRFSPDDFRYYGFYFKVDSCTWSGNFQGLFVGKLVVDDDSRRDEDDDPRP